MNVSGAEAGNYEITYQPGTLTVIEMPSPVVSIVNNEMQISTELDDASWYNLQGVRLSEKPTAPGIYVHGGKKVVIK